MRVIRLLVLCLSLFSLPTFAATVGDLYQVREPVASQQPEERNQALQRALDTLVLRLTGDPAALKNPAVAELRKDPQQLISQYGYEGDALVVDFDPATSERSLRQAGLALWSANRPAILAWWLNEAAGGANLVGDGQDSAAPVRRAAQHRGLPLRLPLADLNEQIVGTADNLTAARPDALREASDRYAADALLAVRAREDGGKWQANWRLWLGDSLEQGSAEGADSAALADAVMLAVSERLAPRFVAAPGAANDLTLEIHKSDLTRYAELERLLEPFGARLKKVEGDRLVYQVRSSPEQLRAQLALSGLQEVQAADAPVDAGQPVAPIQQPAAQVLRFSW